MAAQLLIFSAILAITMAQLCAPGCMQGYNNGGCGGCGGIRAYRLLAPPPMMGPIFGGCGGSPCGQPMMNPCNGGGGGGCGGMGQQAYGIPDPIYTESGRIIRAPFLPPPALPPQPIGQNPMAFQAGK